MPSGEKKKVLSSPDVRNLLYDDDVCTQDAKIEIKCKYLHLLKQVTITDQRKDILLAKLYSQFRLHFYERIWIQYLT